MKAKNLTTTSGKELVTFNLEKCIVAQGTKDYYVRKRLDLLCLNFRNYN